MQGSSHLAIEVFPTTRYVADAQRGGDLPRFFGPFILRERPMAGRAQIRGDGAPWVEVVGEVDDVHVRERPMEPANSVAV